MGRGSPREVMRPFFLAALIAVMLWIHCPSQAQGKPRAKTQTSPKQYSQLAVVETIKIPSEPAEAFIAEEPQRCDADGSFYLRVQVNVEPANRKFNAEGMQEALFRPTS